MKKRIGQSTSPFADEKVATTAHPIETVNHPQSAVASTFDIDVSARTTANCRSVHCNKNGVPSTNVHKGQPAMTPPSKRACILAATGTSGLRQKIQPRSVTVPA